MIDSVAIHFSFKNVYKKALSINIITNDFIALGSLYLCYVGFLAFALHLKQNLFE